MMASLPIATAPVVVTTTSQQWNEASANQRTQQRQQRYKVILKWLAIAEVSLGSFCIIMGALTLAYFGDYYHGFIPSRYSSIGEGVWCGAWIVVAGGLGIAAGKKNSSLCLINTHMAFSIVGAIFAAALIIISSIFAGQIPYAKYVYGIYISVAIAASASLVLQIISAVCCCLAKEGCCRGCCDDSCFGSEPSSTRYVVASGQMPGNQMIMSQMHAYPAGPHLQTQQPVFVVQQPQQPRLLFEQPQQPKLLVEQPQQPRLLVEQPQPQQSVNKIDNQQPDEHQTNDPPVYDNVAFDNSNLKTTSK